jgi:hypothetical protein
MVRLTRQACAKIGRLATPTPDKLGVTVEDKAKDFFREVKFLLLQYNSPHPPECTTISMTLLRRLHQALSELHDRWMPGCHSPGLNPDGHNLLAKFSICGCSYSFTCIRTRFKVFSLLAMTKCFREAVVW